MLSIHKPLAALPLAPPLIFQTREGRLVIRNTEGRLVAATHDHLVRDRDPDKEDGWHPDRMRRDRVKAPARDRQSDTDRKDQKAHIREAREVLIKRRNPPSPGVAARRVVIVRRGRHRRHASPQSVYLQRLLASTQKETPMPERDTQGQRSPPIGQGCWWNVDPKGAIIVPGRVSQMLAITTKGTIPTPARSAPRRTACILGCFLLSAMPMCVSACCSRGGACDTSHSRSSLGTSPELLTYDNPIPVLVESVHGENVWFHASTKDQEPSPKQRFNIFTGPATTLFRPGQSLSIEHCKIGRGPNSNAYISIRDQGGLLIYASSGSGFMALDSPCVPKEIRVSPVTLDCCGVDTPCGENIPLGLKIEADDDVTLTTGTEGSLTIHGRSYVAINGFSVEVVDDGHCTDLVPHIANYGIYLAISGK